MAKFWIKKVSVLGGREPSSIDFINGLNIIFGPSNTGKTYVLNVIDYALGSKHIPILANNLHTAVELVISTEHGDVILTRKINNNFVDVISTNPNIKSASYPISKSENDTISTVLLRLMGINEKPNIIENKEFHRVRMGLRMISHFFIISEENIQSENPILLPRVPSLKTRTVSSLAYLINAKDYSNNDIQATEKEKKIQKKALTDYMNTEIMNYANMLYDLNEELSKIEKPSDDITAKSIIDNLAEIEGKITKLLAKSKENMSEILTCRDHLLESDVLLGQYNELSSQYTADIERLTFILDGHSRLEDVPHNDECPFCNHKLENQHVETYLESSRHELTHIIGLLSGLKSAYTSTLSTRNMYASRLTQLEKEQLETQTFISTKLNPIAINLKQNLDKINKIKYLETQIEVIKRAIEQKTIELDEFSLKKLEKNTKYDVNNVLPDNFAITMNAMLTNVLRSCKFDNFLSVSFSTSNLDLQINNTRKSSFGKGYKSFINSCLAITIREYLEKFGTYNPGLLIIDSPITTFNNGIKDDTPDSMKHSLMMYLINTKEIGQTIILENEIPRINYSEFNNVKTIEFTKGQKNGRYGFLNDVKN